MLQFTLARDGLLVGFGRTAPRDPLLVPKGTPAGGSAQASGARGVRPSIFFGPTRDAHALLTRQLHTVLVLRAKRLRDGVPRLAVLSFPESENVSLENWRAAVVRAAEGQNLVSWIDMVQSRSVLLPDADVCEQVFTPGKGSDLSDAALAGVKVVFESFVHENALREQVHIEGIDPRAYEAYVVHWHAPEIFAAQLLQTTFVESAEAALVSYRGPVWFGVGGSQQGHRAPVAFGECAWLQNGPSAVARLGELLTAMHARDDLLGCVEASQGPAQSSVTRLPVPQHSEMACGKTDGLIAWRWNLNAPFELTYAVASRREELKKSLLSQAPETAFARAREAVLAADRAWVARQKPAPERLPRKIKALYARTLLTLRQMQDTGGGIIAAPEFQFEFTHCGGYGYCWGRDAGFISLAMDMCGMHAESADFYRYMAKCQSDDGSFLHRHDMQGGLGASWGLLQPDETGSVVFGFWEHVRMSGDSKIAEELKGMVSAAAQWLCAARTAPGDVLPVEGFDLWEEREGIHLYSVAAMAAGLQAAVSLHAHMGWSIPAAWTERVNELRTLLNSDFFVRKDAHGTRLVRTLRRRVQSGAATGLAEAGVALTHRINAATGRIEHLLPEDFVVDVSQLGIAVPFAMHDAAAHPGLLQALVLTVNDALWRPGVGGIGRYEGDRYRSGNPWILATLWLALAAHEVGESAIARRALGWACTHCGAEGMFPEQVDPRTGEPSWVMPLTWSHAMFGLAVHMLPAELFSDPS